MKRCEKSPRVSRWPTWSLAWPELAAVFGGAKPKAPITIDGVEWVLKFFNNESADVLLIEHALMALAAQAGMCVAQTVQRVVAVACDAPDLSRLRFSARPPRPSHLAQWLRCSGNPAEGGDQRRVYEQHVRELLCRMAFNILIGKTGDHKKETCCAVGARRCQRSALKTDTCLRRAAHQLWPRSASVWSRLGGL